MAEVLSGWGRILETLPFVVIVAVLFSASAALVAAATLVKQAADDFKALPNIDGLFEPSVTGGIRAKWERHHRRNFARFLVYSLLAAIFTGVASVSLKVGPERASLPMIGGAGFSLFVSGLALLKGYRAHNAARESKSLLDQDIRAAQENRQLRAEARAAIAALQDEESRMEPPIVHLV